MARRRIWMTRNDCMPLVRLSASDIACALPSCQVFPWPTPFRNLVHFLAELFDNLWLAERFRFPGADLDAHRCLKPGFP
jgi:hypothetical protein